MRIWFSSWSGEHQTVTCRRFSLLKNTPWSRTQWPLTCHMTQINPNVMSDHVTCRLLVGGWATPLKNMKVNWDDYSQYMGTLKNVPNHQPEIISLNFMNMGQYGLRLQGQQHADTHGHHAPPRKWLHLRRNHRNPTSWICSKWQKKNQEKLLHVQHIAIQFLKWWIEIMNQ